MLISYGSHGSLTVEQMQALFHWASKQGKEAWKPLPAPARHVLARADNFDTLKPGEDDGVALVWGPVADIVQSNGVGFDAWMDIPD